MTEIPSERRSPAPRLTCLYQVACGAVIVLLCLLFVVPRFSPWTSLNCWVHSVDITCGRYRYERYLLGMKIVDRVEETDLSRRFRAMVGEPPAPLWRRSLTLSPGVRHSPHYHHHSGLHNNRLLTEVLGTERFSDEAVKKIIVSYFALLQQYDNDSAAGSYVLSLVDVAFVDGEDRLEDQAVPSPSRY